jgi:hypothetical protein
MEEVRVQLIDAESSYAKWAFDLQTTPLSGALYDHIFASEPIEWNRIGCFRMHQNDPTGHVYHTIPGLCDS